MPFGLKNAAQTFQRFMDDVPRGLQFSYDYVDDLLIASNTPAEHLDHLRQVFNVSATMVLSSMPKRVSWAPVVLPSWDMLLTAMVFTLHPRECRQSTTSPGRLHRESCGNISDSSTSIESSFLTLRSYYCLSRISSLASRPRTPQSLGLRMLSLPFRRAKRAWRRLRCFTIHTTMLLLSDHAVGAVLQQFSDGSWSPIAYFSKKLQPAQTRCSTFDWELLAVYLAIKHFRHFVEGREFHMLTDHRPLTFSLQAHHNQHSPRQAGPLDFVAQFTTDIPSHQRCRQCSSQHSLQNGSQFCHTGEPQRHQLWRHGSAPSLSPRASGDV